MDNEQELAILAKKLSARAYNLSGRINDAAKDNDKSSVRKNLKLLGKYAAKLTQVGRGHIVDVSDLDL